ncbi:MAG: hypothetical protein Q9164_003954 [Protoblastenia rupestris]
MNDSSAPKKRQRTYSIIVPTSIKTAKQRPLPPLTLSPQKSSLYTRRARTSPIRVPPLPSPRKRDLRSIPDDPAPPSHETNLTRFSVFMSLLAYPELTFEVAKHLNIDELVSLYAISKDFHLVANRRFTALVLGQSVGKASESSRIFVHRCYKNLCMRDPAARPNESREGEIRWIPSFRWLRMILFRERVVDDIIRCLWLEGHRLPQRASLAIKKLWFTLDVSDNIRRIGLIHNEAFWTHKDLFLATMFCIKLDMRLTDPVTGNGEIGLRRLLLNQRSLSTLAKVLKREDLRNQLDLLEMIVRYSYSPSMQPTGTILGVPVQEVGRLQYEGWGVGGRKFIPIDGLVAREAIRRRLNLQNYYLDMMLYGYINKKTWEDIRVPYPRRSGGNGEADGGGEGAKDEREKDEREKDEREKDEREKDEREKDEREKDDEDSGDDWHDEGRTESSSPRREFFDGETEEEEGEGEAQQAEEEVDFEYDGYDLSAKSRNQG